MPDPDTNTHDALEPVAGTKETSVQVLSMRMRIHDLNIEKPSVIAYFKSIPADKQAASMRLDERKAAAYKELEKWVYERTKTLKKERKP